MLTRPSDETVPAGAVLHALGELVAQHVPGFADTQPDGPRQPGERLQAAMVQAQERLQAQAGDTIAEAPAAQLMAALRAQQGAQVQALKEAASTQAERAVIELVAMLFAAILGEERVPAVVRVWFARLQMPTVRVALAEPEFFSSEAHPARRLIDRMGACVMGFDGDGAVAPELLAEIKRVVQTIEAFPDTGRRVFQSVLTEFEAFVARFFAQRNEAARAGVSLAEQIEQRETLAIQFTIELRQRIGELPLDDAVRHFLFKHWADALATAAVRHGSGSDGVRALREAAGELLHAAGAKTSEAERQDTLKRLPGLLAALRSGLAGAGLSAERQAEVLAPLHQPLADAFAARAQAFSADEWEAVQQRLADIDAVVADEDVELGDEWMLGEALTDQSGLELVTEGGSMPTPAMTQRAASLQTGEQFVLTWKGARLPVRLAWHGRHRALTLFAADSGRNVLFPRARLAAYLQAGLLVPVHDDSLTVAATRQALAKVRAEPQRLA